MNKNENDNLTHDAPVSRTRKDYYRDYYIIKTIDRSRLSNYFI